MFENRVHTHWKIRRVPIETVKKNERYTEKKNRVYTTDAQNYHTKYSEMPRYNKNKTYKNIRENQKEIGTK